MSVRGHTRGAASRTAAMAAAAAAASIAFAGCALYSRAPQPTTTEGEWARQRDMATRRALLYDGFDHRATATATLLSLPVREARAHRLAKWFGWTTAELDGRLTQERDEASKGEEFIISFYAGQPKDNDLDAPKSVWRVSVKTEEGDIVASRVTSIERNATTVTLYPYTGPFETLYRVFLPPPPGGPLAGRPFVLEIAGARGKLVLDFRVPNGPTRPQEPGPPL